MMTSIPVVYEREGSSKLVGCLVYLVVAPFVALFLALFASVPLLLGLEALGVPKAREIGNTTFVVLLPFTMAGVAAWGYRDFRRRAALEVMIDRDRVSIGIEGRQRILRFEDVTFIRLDPTEGDFACVLGNRSGRAWRLPPEIAPFAMARDALEITLIRDLVRRLDDRIAGGEAVVLRISSARLLFMASCGVATLLVGVSMLPRPWLIPKAILLLRHASTIFQQVRLGMEGGLVIGREGLRRSSKGHPSLTPWGQLERVRSDPVGLVLRSKSGEVFMLSTLTDDFWPALRWINARLK
jgi:hypothetical protein